MTTEEREILANALAAFPTGNICDAMDELGMQRGAVLGLQPLCATQKRAVGFAVTIQQMRRRPPQDGRGLGKHGMVVDEIAQPGDIVVIEASQITNASTLGGLQALRASVRGIAGLVVNGYIRDAREISKLGLPVYSAGSLPVRSVQDVETTGINVPVSVGEVQIHAGDVIVMDDSGVVVIPVDRAEEVLAHAAAIAKREEQMAEMIKQGHSLSTAFAIPKPSKTK